MFRQGDVALIPVQEVPAGLKQQTSGDVVLALGETTGHSHRFKAGAVCGFYKEGAEDHTIGGGSALVGEATAIAYVSVPEGGAALEHVGEEPHGHDPIQVSPGAYEVRRQREYVAPGLERMVVD